MSIAFGRELAGLLIAVGTAMGAARPTVRRNPPEKWVNNPVEFDQAVRAANLIFEALRPPGDPSPRREHSNWNGPIASEILLTITEATAKASSVWQWRASLSARFSDPKLSNASRSRSPSHEPRQGQYHPTRAPQLANEV